MTPGAFLDRARREALRYGSNPWVFVRELLQNARDAGAASVTITAEETAGVARVAVADDGQGMDFEHARRYLFALYASSKEGDRGAAGRFGVGFWSILRFDPARIVVRSWPGRGAPWEIELDGTLADVRRRTPAARRAHGTEVVLERPAGDGALARRVRDAAWQNARYACRRGMRDRPLEVRVNGEPVTAPFDLPAPSARFRKGRVRGVVALGAEARVELFAQGLRVRSAAALGDLLSPDGGSADARVRFPALADGVAPQAILDGEDFEPLLARTDVRETAGLRRLVQLGQDELRRLVERQLDVVRPPSLAQRVGRPLAVGAVVLAVLAGAWWAARFLPRAAPPPRVPAATAPLPAPAVPSSPAPTAYGDLGGRYQGPRTDTLPAHLAPVALRYEPAEPVFHFAALRLDRPFEPWVPVEGGDPHPAAPCGADCTSVAVQIDDGPGLLRLPVPTGHAVDPTSVRLAGVPAKLRLTRAGEPFVILPGPTRDVLTYRTGPHRDVSRSAVAPAPLPAAAAAFVARLRAAPRAERVARATAWVRENVRYSTAPEVVALYEASAGMGDLPSRALTIGAADCDVQNALLAVVLQAADVPARLAVGYVGARGAALASLHAWAEAREEDGPWRVADASIASAPLGERGPEAAATPAPPAPAATAPTTTRSSAPPALPPSARNALPWLGGAALLGLLALAFVLVRTRTRRDVRVAPSHDVAALLRGALQRPDAFRDAPALYLRPLLPALGGRVASLADASGEAAERRLFRSAAGSALARRAAQDGALVLDASQPESAAVADALGAVDLDEWHGFLEHSRPTPLLTETDRRLKSLGAPWSLRAVAGIGSPAVLDLPARGGTRRVIVFDALDSWLVAAEARFAGTPRGAVLAVADQVAELLRLPPEEIRRVLRPLAREALHEAAS
jgi:hypothetical protein